MPWIFAIMIGALALGGYKLYKMSSDSDKIIPEVKGRVHKIDFSGITIALDVSLKNPGKLRLSMLQPFITMMYREKPVASSNVSDAIITVEPFAITQLKTIYLKISYVSAAPVVLELIKKLKDKETKVDMQVVFATYILAGVKNPLTSLKDYGSNKPGLIEYSKTMTVSV